MVDAAGKAPDKKRSPSSTSSSPLAKKKKSSQLTEESYEIQLNITLQYADPQGLLRRGVLMPPDVEQRNDTSAMFYKFSAAMTYLSVCDLGRMICHLSFNSVESLDKLWDDYLSGHLLASLQDIIITDSLRRKADNEELKLLLYINEDEYQKARNLLLEAAV